MLRLHDRTTTLIIATVVMLVIGCGGSTTRLNGGGATFIYPMMSAWSSEYEKAKKVQVNYQSIGSGGGIQQMTAQTFDFACTDVPMNAERLEKAREIGGDVVHIPLVMGAVVPVYRLKDVKEPLKFTGPVLADIYLGKIKKWNDKALTDLNPTLNLPNQDIVVVHRSDGSGTTYIWVDYLSKVSPQWKEKVGVGMDVNWPVGIGEKQSVYETIGTTEGSIGYIELTYALQAEIQYGVVKNKAGSFIKATLESVTAAADSSLSAIPDDLRYSITDAPGKDAYPICGTVWAVLYKQQPAVRGQALVDFLRWVTHEGQELAADLHYARLPAGLVSRIAKKLDGISVGE